MFTRSVYINRQAVAAASPAPAERTSQWPPRRRLLAESIVAAIVAYALSALFEAAVIRSLQPTEWELAWVGDVVLAMAFGAAVYLWRNLRTTRCELEEREREQLVVETQLSVAAEIQRQLLPAVPPSAYGFEWAAALSSAETIGGDFYDFLQVSPSAWIVLVADVSGKGIPAALALGSLRSSFRGLPRHNPDPARIVAELSAALYDDWHGTLYVTCFVAMFDLRQRTMTSTNAGHPAAIVTGPGGLTYLRRGGPPAGLFRETAFERESLQLRNGDVCLIVTDGVTEALDGDGTLERSVNEAATQHHAGAAEQLCQTLMTQALNGRGPKGATAWDDDRTVVVTTIGRAISSESDPIPRGRTAGPLTRPDNVVDASDNARRAR